jgi:sugar lactone lactonase YvrE
MKTNQTLQEGEAVMQRGSFIGKACGTLPRLRALARALAIAALAAIVGGSLAHAATPYSYYIPTAIPTATSTLYTGSASITPGRIGVDKLGNVFYIGHASGSTSTLYEIPVASPVVTVSSPTALVSGLGSANANGVFVDAGGNLWVSNGNGSGGALLEIPASSGVPNTAAITGNAAYSSGLAISAITTACTSSSTDPCLWAASSILSSLSSLQIGDIYSDGAGNLVLVDVNDSVSSGSYNRILSFATSSKGSAKVLADKLTSNAYAQATVAGDGNVYYCDSVTGNSSGGLVSQVSSGTLTTIGNLSKGSLTLNSVLANVSAATGVTTDPWGNLIMTGAKQISEIPMEGGVLATAEQFLVLFSASSTYSPVYTNNILYGGSFDVHGNYYYATNTNIMQTQVNGYNFGNVNVGNEVTTAAPYLNMTWSLASNIVTSGVFPTASPSALTAANAAYLQSFPYSGTKDFYGSSSWGLVNTLTNNAKMYFQPIHPGLLRGSISPAGYATAEQSVLGSTNGSFVANLQGVGVGPQPMFLPGTATQAITKSTLYTSVSHSTKAVGFVPTSVATDTYGDIFVTDNANSTLDIQCLPTTSNTAASGSNYCASNGTGYTFAVTGTTFVTPIDLVLDSANNVYVLDAGSGTPIVTRFNFGAMISNTVIPSGSTVAGTAISGPRGMAIDGYGNLYIADTGNNRILQGRLYNAQYSQNIVYVPATAKFGGTALSSPNGLAVDAAGNLFIADTGNQRIVEYSVTGVTSVVSTSGVTLEKPTSVKVLPSGALIVADNGLGLVLVDNGVGSILSTGSITLSGTQGVGLDLAGNIYVADPLGDQVVELNVNSPATATAFSATPHNQSSSETSWIYNSGNTALTISSTPTAADSSSAASNEFAIDANNTCVANMVLAVGNNCNLIADFAPAATANPLSTVPGTITLTDSVLPYSLTSNSAYTSEDIAQFGTDSSTHTEALTGVVAGTPQTITFTTPTPVTWSTSIAPIQLVATGGASGNPVIFSIVSGSGTLGGTNNSVLTVTDIGSTVIAANQASGGPINGVYYSKAATVMATMVVKPIGVVATPTFSVASGTYTAAQSVTISDSTPGVAIYYTTNGNDPTISSMQYTGTPITVSVTTTIKAIAVETGYTNSAIALATYTLNPDFSINSYVTTFNLVNGLDGSSTVAVTPLFNFTSTITLTCSGIASTDTCSFSPTTVKAADGTTTQYATLYVKVNEKSAANQMKQSLFAPATALAALICCFGLRKRRRLLMVVLLVLSGFGMSLMTACSSASTKAKTSTFTITGTSGSIVHTQTITLNVSNI